jgi:uncharacterized protein (DUF1330 family)
MKEATPFACPTCGAEYKVVRVEAPPRPHATTRTFQKATQKDILNHGGKYLAGGYNKTLGLSGAEPPNRVVIVQFANMDAVKEWREQGAMDMENTVGSKYASFRIYAVEGLTQ